MKTVHGFLVVSPELVAVDQTLVRVETLPLTLLLLPGVGEDVDGDAQYVGQAVQLALCQVERVQRLLSLEELQELSSISQSPLSRLANFTFNLHLQTQMSDYLLRVW